MIFHIFQLFRKWFCNIVHWQYMSVVQQYQFLLKFIIFALLPGVFIYMQKKEISAVVMRNISRDGCKRAYAFNNLPLNSPTSWACKQCSGYNLWRPMNMRTSAAVNYSDRTVIVQPLYSGPISCFIEWHMQQPRDANISVLEPSSGRYVAINRIVVTSEVTMKY